MSDARLHRIDSAPSETDEGPPDIAVLRRRLRQQRDLYEAVVQEQHELVCRYLPDTTLVFVNEAYCRYYRATREALLGTRFIDRVSDDWKDELLGSLGELVPDETNTFERSDVRPDGSTVWLQWHRIALAGPDGRVAEIQSVGRDITELKAAQEAVQRERTRYQSIIDDQNEPIVRYSPDGVRTFVNPAYCALRGRPAEALLGKSFYDWHTPEFSDVLRANLAGIPAGSVKTFEVEDNSFESGPRWMQWSTRAYGDDQGRVIEYQSVGRDISVARRHRMALEMLNRIAVDAEMTTREQIRTLLSYGCTHFELEVGIVSRVEEGVYTIVESVSPDGQPAAGTTFPLGVTFCAEVVDARGPLSFNNPEEAGLSDHPCYTEFGLTAFIGTPIFVEGDIYGTLSFCTKASRRAFDDLELDFVQLFASWIGHRLGADLQTQKLEAENALRARAEGLLAKQVHQLEEINAELEQFAYVASHDLQEPLRRIESASAFLMQDYRQQLDADGVKLLSITTDGAHSMRALIEDLLRFSRVGSAKLADEPVDLSELLSEAQDNLAQAVRDSGAQITSDPLPVLRADGSLVRQLFQNLLANAIKYRGDGAPHIHVSACEGDADWTISVSDNGIGIDPSFADRIFEVFQRLHRKSDYPGTGIGLAICKRIVERHNGRIWLDTSHKDGARFCFTLPKQETA